MAYVVAWTVVLVVALAVTLAAERKKFFSRVLYKMIASAAFLVIAYLGGALETPYGRWVFFALILCWLGDLLLAYRDKTLFLGGLFAFLGAHGAFMYAFYQIGIHPVWAVRGAVCLLVSAVFIVPWLRPHVARKMKGPVYAYMLVISAMVALSAGAVGAGGPVILIPGAVLFYISDIFVARQRFVESGFSNSLLGLPPYYAAVWCFAVSIWMRA
ncbi:MAG: lysoplasmalogenase [Candidatus Hydrogenedentes bacterium]|nr:lysoplasmalogenase [Candidatus Hydrogenedentota bacterium]